MRYTAITKWEAPNGKTHTVSAISDTPEAAIINLCGIGQCVCVLQGVQEPELFLTKDEAQALIDAYRMEGQ